MPDFSKSRALAQQAVDKRLLAGFSSVVMQHGQVVESFCTGLANLESGEPFGYDPICRIFSNTKLITSTLVLMMVDEGRFGLDDPVKHWVPELGRVRVLRPGATSADDTEALRTDITVRHLLSHSSGLSHGVFDPGTLIYKAYVASGVRSPQLTLAEAMPVLAALPLSFQPGTGWDYSMGADVLARIVEIITGKPFAEVVQQRIFGPLGMVDTSYVVPPEKLARFATLYRSDDPVNAQQPLSQIAKDTPWAEANIRPVPRTAGTGGLVSTQGDYLRFLLQLQAPATGQPGLLKPATLAEMLRDQLPPHICVQFMRSGPMPHLGFGLGGAITRSASDLQPNSPAGEFQWGGLGGTHWSISPAQGVTIVQMAQRHFGFWNPFWFEYKAAVYAALGA